jgi:hypothetical protein
MFVFDMNPPSNRREGSVNCTVKHFLTWQKQHDTGVSLMLGQPNKLTRDGIKIAFHPKQGRITNELLAL